MKHNFQDLFGEEVKTTVNTEIRNSQDEFIEAVYPIIGKLVRRYVSYQFELFTEAMDEQRKNAFSFKRCCQKVCLLFAIQSPSAVRLSSSRHSTGFDMLLLYLLFLFPPNARATRQGQHILAHVLLPPFSILR